MNNNRTANNRDSNIELARIISMLMILALHAFNTYFWNSNTDYWSTTGVLVNMGECLTGCAVGLFVFISGWYGIKPKKSSIFNIIFQVLFYGLLIFICDSIINGSISTKGLKDVFLLSDALWFVKSYFLLYILSPVLNSFVEHAEQKQFRLLLAAFFIFQTIWGWTDTAGEFKYGLSVVFFLFMYLLARYLRLFPNRITSLSSLWYLVIYIFSSLLTAVTLYVKHLVGIIPHTEQMLLSYVSPFMILSSVSLFLFFSKIQFRSKAVNWIAASCLSVYLIHENSVIAPYYRNCVWNELLEAKYLLFAETILLVFITCVAVDQTRRAINHVLSRQLFNKTSSLVDNGSDSGQ